MFIVFEGIDTAGKSSLVERLRRELSTENLFFTREPGGSGSLIAERIRRLLLETKEQLSPYSETLLFLLSRRIHFEEIIKRRLEEGKVVISDRYFFSSLAYQARESNNQVGFTIAEIKLLNEIVTEDLYPDLIIYLDISLKEFKTRARRGIRPDRFESKGPNYLEKVLNIYHHIFKEQPQLYLPKRTKLVILDATKSHEEVFEELKRIIRTEVEGLNFEG